MGPEKQNNDLGQKLARLQSGLIPFFGGLIATKNSTARSSGKSAVQGSDMESSHSSDVKTFADRFAKYYIGCKGFYAGTVPEAVILHDACDMVLTYADGMMLQTICIVDRDAHPQKTFALSRETLDDIGRQCLKYTGTINRAKISVNFQIMEIGGGSLTEHDRHCLKSLKRRSFQSKVVITFWRLDLSTGKVWTNAPMGGWLMGRLLVERLVKAPNFSDEDSVRPEIAVPSQRFPLITVSLLAALTIAFFCEFVFSVEPWSGLLEPNIQTLVALGGLEKTLVLKSAEWYRIFSSAFLHLNLIHFAINSFCLYMAGTVLEYIVGRRWFFVLFMIGCISGSLMSLLINPASTVSVGTSGAIMCLLAAAFICSFRFPPGALRTQAQMITLQMLIPSLIPLATNQTGHPVDFASHIGGALSGAAVGFALLKTWQPTSTRPAGLILATTLCTTGVFVLALSVLQLTHPNDSVPKSRSLQTFLYKKY